MFETLVVSRRELRPFRRSTIFAVALSLHLCLVAAVVLTHHFRAPASSEPPIRVTFLNFASRPGPAGPATAPSAQPAPEAVPEPVMVAAPAPRVPAEAPNLLRLEAEALPSLAAQMLQPQTTPDAISTEPMPGIPADGGAGIEGGLPGGVPDGQPLPVGPLWVGGGVSAPVVLHRVRPDYPRMARSARIEGEVILEAVILRDGSVGEIRVIQGLPFGCTDAAIEALRHWRFQPGERDGIPVDVYFNLTVDFILN